MYSSIFNEGVSSFSGKVKDGVRGGGKEKGMDGGCDGVRGGGREGWRG